MNYQDVRIWSKIDGVLIRILEIEDFLIDCCFKRIRLIKITTFDHELLEGCFETCILGIDECEESKLDRKLSIIELNGKRSAVFFADIKKIEIIRN
ncbi:hypothetical protein CH373_14155 [Leptospira perolatii]|uniref:Uncharacterized protein n=1 Tax=Leptospira perolatii TaxID=2023191 RepID=A0A2M9ZKF5_9LEPT|nr:hypothetical protein [Leptospira perolatii]PJZ69412.1 hypothetical protein CH360_11720 [Leptospira perolatii]PJZ72547.1 hypothetical protein CH373_14155 [Leptospira perolatii]